MVLSALPSASVSAETLILITFTLTGVLAVVASLWVVMDWFQRPMGKRLQTILSERDEIAVLIHPDPDPDAMASAMGVAHLADTVDTDATIYFSGQIRHQENRVFRNILDPDLNEIQHIDDVEADDVVLVDHSTPRGFKGSKKLMPLAIVDHHPDDGTGLEFTDKRSSYGSCASIVAEYLRDVGVTPLHPDEFEDLPEQEQRSAEILPPTVTTGLMYGIHSDTNRLTSGCIEDDHTAAAYLCSGVDEELLGRIANPEVDTEVLDAKSRAISNRTEQGSFIVSSVGQLNNTDAIPQAADELIQLEGVTAAVVYGCREGEIRLSGRSRDDRVHMGDALEAVITDIPGSSAGGHSRMGGAQVPLESLDVEVDDETADIEREIPSSFDEQIFAALEGDV